MMGSSVSSDCVFCRLVTEGDHVRRADGFVAIRDINPRADTHLLILPERHIESFRDVGELSADEAKQMLDFVAETARGARLRDASRRAELHRWRRKVGSQDVVLVDRPGRGYGDDYCPWLVDAPVGAVVRARAVATTDDGIVGVL